MCIANFYIYIYLCTYLDLLQIMNPRWYLQFQMNIIGLMWVFSLLGLWETWLPPPSSMDLLIAVSPISLPPSRTPLHLTCVHTSCSEPAPHPLLGWTPSSPCPDCRGQGLSLCSAAHPHRTSPHPFRRWHPALIPPLASYNRCLFCSIPPSDIWAEFSRKGRERERRLNVMLLCGFLWSFSFSPSIPGISSLLSWG